MYDYSIIKYVYFINAVKTNAIILTIIEQRFNVFILSFHELQNLFFGYGF